MSSSPFSNGAIRLDDEHRVCEGGYAMYVCLCKGITESEFLQLVSVHQGTLSAIAQSMGLDDSCCGRCQERLPELLDQTSQPSIEEPRS
ncbi:MAG: hypothetical protein D6690_02515 [Nitrospirae bacterium]|nr:MAG: hypothetical protein D6690_02515 [Nitrospirota bacterium]